MEHLSAGMKGQNEIQWRKEKENKDSIPVNSKPNCHIIRSKTAIKILSIAYALFLKSPHE